MINLFGVFLTVVTLLASGAAMLAPTTDARLGGAILTVLAQIAAMICFLRGSSHTDETKSP